MDKVIAIDGPAAAGKSTVARQLAARLHLPYINTGNMYRAVAWFIIKNIGPATPLAKLEARTVKGFLAQLNLEYKQDRNQSYYLAVNGVNAEPHLRAPEMADAASTLAALPAVREWLLAKQRTLLSKDGKPLVMEGRDVGTVVFPHAQYKFFITASPEERARRRLAQEGESADGATLASVAQQIAARDAQDRNRKIAPLKQAEDAVLIDTSTMTIDQVVDQIMARLGTT